MSNESLLTRDQSNCIKGILILLIILGHNSILMHLNSDDINFKNWLYSFHVKSFLFLPFLYNYKKFQIKSLKKNAKRLLIPYSIFFVILFVINFFNVHTFNVLTTVWAYITGSQILLREVTGLIYIWFLPSMFSILVFKDLSYSNGIIKTTLLCVGIGCIILEILYIAGPEIEEYTPLGIYQALISFPIALVLRCYMERTKDNKRNLMLFLSFAFLLSMIWFLGNPQNYLWSACRYLLLPITIFPCIFYGSKLTNPNNIFIQFFIFLGKLSMGLYLIHQIIYNLILRTTSGLILNKLIYGIFLYILTIVVSLIVVLFIKKYCQKVYKVIF